MAKNGETKSPRPASDRAIRLSDHPRAAPSIRRIRGWSGLIGFAAVTLLSLRGGLLLPDAVVRGLAGGAAAHFTGWFVALKLWKQVVLGELTIAQERHEQRIEEVRRRAAEEAAARLAADAAERAAVYERH